MTLISNQPQILLNCLERFEQQSKEITDRHGLVTLFCEQVIPLLGKNALLDDLRKHWVLKRDLMHRKIQEKEVKALEEVKATFDELKEAIGNQANKNISQKLILIEGLITGEVKWYGNPLYRILYGELKQLFVILLNKGYIDLCKKYAKIATHKVCVQTDANQGERWVQVLEEGRTSHILAAAELAVLRREDPESLMPISPDHHFIDETCVEEFFFAPAVLEAYASWDEVNWDCLCDPTVVWWYFESALHYWKTTEFYFDEVVRPKNGTDHEKHFKTTCEKMAWREIASVRNHDDSIKVTIIFTDNFFRVGLRTLVNVINAHISQDPALSKAELQIIEPALTTFELALDGHELWVNVTFENQAVEKFFIQQFHEGPDPAGSRLHQFMKDTLEDPSSGIRKAKLIKKWESASKHIDRIKLPMVLKREFFTESHGSHFRFHGARISLKSNDGPDVKLSLHELRKNHLKSRKTALI